MSEVGVIILVLSAAGLLGLVAYMLYLMFRTEYPEGKRFTIELDIYRINLIFHPNVTIDLRLKDTCANVLRAVVSASRNTPIVGTTGFGLSANLNNLRTFTVCIVPTLSPKADFAAFVSIEDKIPTIFMFESFVEEAIETGEPLIHECMHILLNEYAASGTMHSHARVWHAVSGDNSIQGKARITYLKLKEEDE